MKKIVVALIVIVIFVILYYSFFPFSKSKLISSKYFSQYSFIQRLVTPIVNTNKTLSVKGFNGFIYKYNLFNNRWIGPCYFCIKNGEVFILNNFTEFAALFNSDTSIEDIINSYSPILNMIIGNKCVIINNDIKELCPELDVYSPIVKLYQGSFYFYQFDGMYINRIDYMRGGPGDKGRTLNIYYEYLLEAKKNQVTSCLMNYHVSH